MKIKFFLLIIFSFFSIKSFCQIDESTIKFSELIYEKKDIKYIVPKINKWSFPKELKLDISNILFKDWNAGGTNNVSFNSQISGNINYRDGSLIFESSYLIRYGFIYENTSDSLLRKVNKLEDRLEFSAALSYFSFNSEKWLYSTNLTLRTQIDKGYPNKSKSTMFTSAFFAPAYLNFNVLGMEYKIDKVPNNLLYFFISPLSNKTTFVLNDTLSKLGSFGVKKGDYSRTEFGLFFENRFSHEIYKNINIKSKLILFSNYLKDFGNIDINWNLESNMIVNKYIQFNIYLELIYDDDIKISRTLPDKTTIVNGATVQIKQRTGLSFIYSF